MLPTNKFIVSYRRNILFLHKHSHMVPFNNIYCKLVGTKWPLSTQTFLLSDRTKHLTSWDSQQAFTTQLYKDYGDYYWPRPEYKTNKWFWRVCNHSLYKLHRTNTQNLVGSSILWNPFRITTKSIVGSAETKVKLNVSYQHKGNNFYT